MKKFKRQVTEYDKLYTKFINSGQYTGFLNEKLLETKDRDFWTSYMDEVLTDPYTSSQFEGVLIAYKKIPYSAQVMQDAILQNQGDGRVKAGDVYSAIDPEPFDIYRCIFSMSPVNYTSAKAGAQIYNTLKLFEKDSSGEIKGEYRGYKTVDKVISFFRKQLSTHMFDRDKFVTSDNLLTKNTVDIIVPCLKRGFYMVGGQDRRPLLGETYYHNMTTIGQQKFIFKQKYKNNIKKYTAYFSTGTYTKNDYNKKIFYAKFFTETFINPFLIFEKEEVDSIVRKLLENGLSDKTKEILLNTYECYLREIDWVKTEHKNRVPSIYKYIDREDDADYMKKKAKMFENEEAQDLEDAEFLDDEDDDRPFDSEDTDEVLDDNASYGKKEREFTVTRSILTQNTLYKLIMGFEGKVYYSFYPHLENQLLKIADMSKSGFRNEGGSSPTIQPRGLQFYKTVISNSDIMNTNDSHNPIDIFNQIQLKKIVFDVDTSLSAKANKRGQKTAIPPSMRYRQLGVDYGIHDTHTVKSPEASGLQGNASILQVFADHFLTREDYDIRYEEDLCR